ncbi:hypothetical protein JVX98_13420 [Ensifer sp. PDNC004]|uniref:hypothetical protein n=1 Tax=Ensifer sp. PDNC004 TaxID=2811423 RepID=UPI001965034F|nr:hypothetical protein [Ensifer sp. PDNC004]QRY69153.1 hypothetical protein JVX98_13090 [Ensifer sp. PDNC004]QRY69215.1 hypothetical protein JVX98_13420 [Ensifer sp. PDNC004]
MSETKHTRGPWEFDGPPDNIIVWSGPEARVCFLTSDGPTEANGRLIAAAPDLLAALKAAEPYVEALHSLMNPESTRSQVWSVVKQLRAAISKAEGSLT